MGVRFGRYETLYPLASGGMATVHLARAIGAGGFERLVAIKVMHPGLGEDPDFAAMFLDEARVAARIRHPNVVGTVDVQEGGPDGLFLVMEYVEGPSLFALSRTLAKKGRRMPIGVALRVVIDALLGLHAAHEQTGPTGEPLQIVHRDVSPQNVLVSVDGQAKITDFGVARAEARLSSTRRGEVKGKLAYMSPQQVRADPIDRRADVYAAGVVLWELLAGQRLFTGDNDGALVVSVMAGAARSPRDVDPNVPVALDRECMRALRVDPAERPPTALAFAEALEIAAEEAGVTLATPRVLAAFVKEIAAHKPLDVPPAEPSGSAPKARASIPGYEAGRAPMPAGDDGLSPGSMGSAPHRASIESPSRPGQPSAALAGQPLSADGTLVMPASSPGALPPFPASPPSPPDANSQVASVISASHPPFAPRRSPVRTIAIVGALALVGGLALLGSRLFGGEGSNASPGASASVAPPAMTASPSSTGVANTAAPPSATPTASAPQASESAKPRAGSPKPTSPAPRGPKGPRSPGATDWKPEGL